MDITEEQRAQALDLLRAHKSLMAWCARRAGLLDADGAQVVKLAFTKAAYTYDPARGSFTYWAVMYARYYTRHERLRRLPVHVPHDVYFPHPSKPVSTLRLAALERCGVFEVVDIDALPEDEEPVDAAATDFDDDTLARAELITGLVRLDQLRPRLAEVLVLRLAPMTLTDIAAMWGVTRERVRQLEARAVQELRALLLDGSPRPRGGRRLVSTCDPATL